MEHDATLPEATHQHQCHHRTQQPEVDCTVKTDPWCIRRRVHRQHALAAIKPGVQTEKNDEQRAHQKQCFGQNVVKRPEEIHALEKAQKQGRITQRGERASGIGNHKDEKHDDVSRMDPVVVGANQRADHQHRCARSPHDARQRRADGKNASVQRRAAMQIATDENATRHRKQCRQQNDEGDVLSHQRMHQAAGRGTGTINHTERKQKSQGPGC